MENITERISVDNRKTDAKLYAKQTRIFCVGLVLLFSVSLALPVTAQAASLYFSPPSGYYTIGQTFTTSVYISSPSQAINATSGRILFPKDNLEVISLSKTGSIISFWVQEPSFSNVNGTINFEGIVLNPGYQGSAGKVISIQFRTKQVGQVNLNITDASVLANDGLGTQILSNISGAAFNINPKITEPIAPTSETPIEKIGVPLAPKIISSTHPDPDKWYTFEIAKFSWQLPKDIDAVRVSINKISNAKPTVIYIPPITSKEITDLEEDTWYFHAQLKNEYGWGDISHFRIQIDKTVPNAFKIKIDNQGDFTNPQPLLYFEAKDDLSGIEYYEVKIGQIHNLKVSADEVKNGYYKIPVTPPGEHSIIIRAMDKAGNYSLAMSDLNITSIEPPVLTEYPKRLYPDIVLTVKGIAKDGVKIILSVENEKKEIVTSLTNIEDGKWSAIVGTLEKGVYTIWAEAIDSRGAKSLVSEKVRILASPPVFIKIGNLVIDYLSVVITLIALFVFMLMTWFYGWRRIKILKAQLKKETTDAEEMLYRAFNILRKEVTNQVAKSDKREGLSKREKVIDEKLKEALGASESLIAKEIKDIEKKLKS